MHPFAWMTPFYRDMRRSRGWFELSPIDRVERLKAAIRRRPPNPYIPGFLDTMDELRRWPRALEQLEQDFLAEGNGGCPAARDGGDLRSDVMQASWERSGTASFRSQPRASPATTRPAGE